MINSTFDGVVNSYQELASTVLFTLHAEMRTHVLQQLSHTLKAGTYQLSEPSPEPDPQILVLNADLVAFEEDITAYLRDREHGFITHGMALLTDTLLIQASSGIEIMTAHGAKRMLLNILVLQQNLKALESSSHSAASGPHKLPLEAVSLSRSIQFYDLFALGPDQLVKKAQKEGSKIGFQYEELKVMVELMYSEQLKGERRENMQVAKRGLDDTLLQLTEFLWQS
jgi:exocyst complex component 4